jgi:hypothetical protein
VRAGASDPSRVTLNLKPPKRSSGSSDLPQLVLVPAIQRHPNIPQQKAASASENVDYARSNVECHDLSFISSTSRASQASSLALRASMMWWLSRVVCAYLSVGNCTMSVTLPTLSSLSLIPIPTSLS